LLAKTDWNVPNSYYSDSQECQADAQHNKSTRFSPKGLIKATSKTFFPKITGLFILAAFSCDTTENIHLILTLTLLIKDKSNNEGSNLKDVVEENSDGGL